MRGVGPASCASNTGAQSKAPRATHACFFMPCNIRTSTWSLTRSEHAVNGTVFHDQFGEHAVGGIVASVEASDGNGVARLDDVWRIAVADHAAGRAGLNLPAHDVALAVVNIKEKM